jgi:hypothetical protein
MLYAILISILFSIFAYLANAKLNIGFSLPKIISELRKIKTNWNTIPYLYLAFAYILFMLLPLVWGLTFYLQSDANVVVVVIFLTWTYNWTRYIFLNSKA